MVVQQTHLNVFDVTEGGELQEPLLVSEQNFSGLRRGEVRQVNIMVRRLDDHIMETIPLYKPLLPSTSPLIVRIRRGGLLLPAQSGVKVLDDAQFPLRGARWEPEYLRGAVVLPADTERTGRWRRSGSPTVGRVHRVGTRRGGGGGR